MRHLALSLVVCLLSVSAFAAGTASELFISEYVEGSSNNKAIEIYNGTGTSINMGNYQIRQYSNGSTTPSATISFAGNLNHGDVWVLVHTSASPVLQAQADAFTSAGLFNGNDAIALVKNGVIIDVIGQIGNDPGSQWGTGLTSTADNTLRRKAEICAGDPIGNDFFDPSVQWVGFANDTFNGIGSHTADCTAGPPPPPPVPVVEIYAIQGSGSASPYAGQTVETRDNIVTAVGPTGFFIQTPDFRADASTSTSNGIFVFTGSAPAVEVGDQVDVKGPVIEFFNMTEFSGSLTITEDAHNMPLPAYTSLAAGFSSFEQLEGMLVRAVNGAAAAGTDQFNATMIVSNASRPFRTPGINGGNYPQIVEVDPTALGGAAQQIVGGATITLAEGPLAFSFGDYVIWTTALQYTNPAFPRPVRARNAGEFTVAAQNMFRLFDDRDNPSLGEPVPGTAAYQARLAAFSNHVRNVLGSPDVVAVSEVEDLTTLEDLAARLNADGGDYTAYLLEGNDIGGIDVGFLVRDAVSVASMSQIGAGDTWIAPGETSPELLNDRPPLLLTGSYDGNGEPFPIAVIAVHQRSLIDVETSARVRAKRQEQATRLANAIAAMQPGTRLAVTGDFNAFEFNDGYVDVMNILTSGASLTNQVLSVASNDRYSYIEDGVAQVLDHTLTSAPLNPFVRGFQFARANADAPAASNAASDHDGLVLFVMSDHDADGLADDNDACPTGDARATVIIGDCDSGAPNLSMGGGCTLADKLKEACDGAKNHGQCVSAAGKLLNGLMKDGLLTGAQKGAIESCIARF